MITDGLADQVVTGEANALKVLLWIGYTEEIALDILTYGNWIEGEHLGNLIRVWAGHHAR